jgi:DNA-binding beta-propeller fold protein YncE
VAPGGNEIYTVSSGIFDEGIEQIDAKTLLPVPEMIGDLWLGVAADGSGNVYASGGAADQVYHFASVGPALLDESLAGPVPSDPLSQGTSVLGFPGTLLLTGSTGPLANKLFVAGNLSVPEAAIDAADPTAGACPGGYPAGDPICSVISVLDVSSPSSPKVEHLVPVGRDAYGMAFAPTTSTLYVANWADKTNPSRAGGTGTVSVVQVAADGSGHEVQVVPVGLDPTGIALSPAGDLLAVADSDSDQVSLLHIDPSTGKVASTTTVSVGAGRSTGSGTAGLPGTQPMSVAWAPNGQYLFVALGGLNAVEVLDSAGQPIPESTTVNWQGQQVQVSSPATYIPVGWYPDALAIGPNPSGGTRLYVSNLYGMGAGPGFNLEVEPVDGSRTEGSLSAIDLPGSTSAAAAFQKWTSTVVENDDLAPLDDPSLSNPATDPCLGASLPGGGTVTSGLLCQASKGRLDPNQLHVVEVLAENKTFDSYFGDIGGYFPDANASPLFSMYPYAVTTNQHLIAEQYNLSDNFFNEGGKASVLGHDWFESGIATPYKDLGWAQSYDPENLRGNRLAGEWSGAALNGKFDPNVAAEESAMNSPPEQIFDLFQNPATNPNGLTEAVYSTDWSPASPAAKADQAPAALWGQGANPVGGGSDETMLDTDRVNLFLTGETVSHTWDITSGAPPSTFGTTVGYCGGPANDCGYAGSKPSDYSNFTLASWTSKYQACRDAGGTDTACQQQMPNFTYMVLPENAGGLVDTDTNLNPLDPTPQQMVADNDEAVGNLVQGLSQSPFWKDTVVLVTEDDTQMTGDHVDADRTFLLAAGGLVRMLGPSHQVSHQHGSYTSVLKTVETLFGMPSMTLFDQSAVPLAGVIGDSIPAKAPEYTAVPTLFPVIGGDPPLAPLGLGPLPTGSLPGGSLLNALLD